MKKFNLLITFLILFGTFLNLQSQNKFSNRKINNLKNQVSQLVEEDKKMTQVMVDKVFSFSELGFQEFQTSNYLSSILAENGFEIESRVIYFLTTIRRCYSDLCWSLSGKQCGMC